MKNPNLMNKAKMAMNYEKFEVYPIGQHSDENVDQNVT
jgi:hypothetical protein